jgi:surfactin family lipopeptide synthetase A
VISAMRHVSDAERRRLEQYLRKSELPVPLATDTAITRRTSTGPAPLSFPQEQVLRRSEQNEDKPPLYNECITVHRDGALDVSALERSLKEIIRRHEIWRTSYDTVDGHAVQLIHAATSHFSLPVLDLRGLAKSEQEAGVLRSVERLTRCPFDLKRGPLLRFLLITMDDTVHRLVLVAHQSVVDGVSVYRVFPTELVALYRAFSNGNPSPLPEPTIQFSDYTEWQRSELDVRQMARQMNYWRERLAGELPILRWPADHARPKASSYKGLIRPFAFPDTLTVPLRSTAQREGVTLFMTLLSGFVALLHRYTMQADVLVGTLSPAGRKRTELQGLLGYFLNPVALRFDLSSNPKFSELLQQARVVVSEAISNDDLPFELLAERLGTASGPDRHPFFSVAISLQPTVPETIRPGWDVTSMDVGSGGSPWDLYLAFIDRPAGMIGRAQYNPDLFDEATITGMLRDFQALLEAAILQPQLRLSDLPNDQQAMAGAKGELDLQTS